MGSQNDDIGSPDDLIDSPTYTGSSQLSSGLKSPIKSPDGSLPTAPPRSRRTGGWADEAIKSGKKRNASSNLIEQERFRSPETIDNDFDDDIPVIPDLDEMAAAEASAEIAYAPSIAVNRVATYQELDSDLFKHPAFATLDDVNLQLLTKCLNLEGDLIEEDQCWTWDLLFTNVSSELHSEWEAEVSEKEVQAS
ncbi:intraflagellar transport protein 43 homolog isoform X2 [Anabrus simplex]